MATFSGVLPEYSKKTSGGVTWTVTVSYDVTPSDNLDGYSINLTLKAKRNGTSTSYNEEGSSYVYYTVNGIDSNKKVVKWTAEGGKTITVGTYTTEVSSNDVDFSNGIPVEVYWHTGITSNYCPASVTVSGAIEIPEEYAGLIYIDNGTSFDAYLVYIDNGTEWERYIPYIDNGISWDLCS